MNHIHASRVILLFLALSCLQSAAAAQTDKVDDYIKTQMDLQKIPGLSIAVMRNGEIVKAKGYGLANVELNVPAKPETVYQSGSMGKQFTATAVMMLVEEGKIALDDKINKFVGAGYRPAKVSTIPGIANRFLPKSRGRAGDVRKRRKRESHPTRPSSGWGPRSKANQMTA